jgi:hypothetical protein
MSNTRADLGPKPADSPYMTADEAAAYCRRRKKTLLNHKAQGLLRAVPGTRPPLFMVEDLDAWLNGRNRR